jgi:hypothetical protein
VTEKNLTNPAAKATAASSRPKIRAVSLIQPWAWALVHGPKWIENRVWWAPLVGHELVLHASLRPSPSVYQANRERLLRCMQALGLELELPHVEDLTFGAVIGRARVADLILPGGYRSAHPLLQREARTFYALHGRTWGADLRKGGAELSVHPLARVPWHFVEQFGYVLEDRRALLEPVAWKGRQKHWTVPLELEQELARRELGTPRPEGIAA